jgi:hypothetical protein
VNGVLTGSMNSVQDAGEPISHGYRTLMSYLPDTYQKYLVWH